MHNSTLQIWSGYTVCSDCISNVRRPSSPVLPLASTIFTGSNIYSGNDRQLSANLFSTSGLGWCRSSDLICFVLLLHDPCNKLRTRGSVSIPYVEGLNWLTPPRSGRDAWEQEAWLPCVVRHITPFLPRFPLIFPHEPGDAVFVAPASLTLLGDLDARTVAIAPGCLNHGLNLGTSSRFCRYHRSSKIAPSVIIKIWPRGQAPLVGIWGGGGRSQVIHLLGF